MKSYLENEKIPLILNDSRRIFNFIPTAMFMSPDRKGVFTHRNGVVKNFATLEASCYGRECLTVFLGGNANGNVAPPLVVFDDVKLSPEMVDLMPHDVKYAMQPGGWFTAQTFLKYLVEDFVPWLNDQVNIQRPVLLLVNGNFVMLSMSLTSFCRENDIILFALHPNTSQICHPMHDFIETFTKEYLHVRQNWPTNAEFTKLNFIPLFKTAFEKTINANVLPASFRKCGQFGFQSIEFYSDCHFILIRLFFRIASIQSRCFKSFKNIGHIIKTHDARK